jgi:hypothetical protein
VPTQVRIVSLERSEEYARAMAEYIRKRLTEQKMPAEFIEAEVERTYENMKVFIRLLHRGAVVLT